MFVQLDRCVHASNLQLADIVLRAHIRGRKLNCSCWMRFCKKRHDISRMSGVGSNTDHRVRTAVPAPRQATSEKTTGLKAQAIGIPDPCECSGMETACLILLLWPASPYVGRRNIQSLDLVHSSTVGSKALERDLRRGFETGYFG